MTTIKGLQIVIQWIEATGKHHCAVTWVVRYGENRTEEYVYASLPTLLQDVAGMVINAQVDWYTINGSIVK